jgi:hypothetical protein
MVMQLSSSSFFGYTVGLGGLQLVIACSNSTCIERCDGWLQVIICSLITLGVLSASRDVTEGLVWSWNSVHASASKVGLVYCAGVMNWTHRYIYIGG